MMPGCGTNRSRILECNLSSYDDIEESKYIYRETHWVRAMLAMRMIESEVRRRREAGTGDFRLLSIACSTGIIEERLVQMGLEVYAVDVARAPLELAKDRGICVQQADASDNLPYKDGSFDFIFAGEIIEHLIDTKTFLCELNRILRDDGILLLTTPNLARFPDRIRFLIGKAPRHTTPMHEYLFLHIRPFTSQSLQKSLWACGFDIKEFKSNFVFLDPFQRTGVKSRLLARLFPSLGESLIVKARKIGRCWEC